MFELDHLVITVSTLDEGTRAVEDALGLPLSPGGRHPHMGTHNRLLSLGPEIYLEVIAIDPDAPQPDYPRWYRMDEFSAAPRLTNWACRTDDLGKLLETAPDGMGTPWDLQRGDMRWQMAVPETGRLPFDDAAPALLAWLEGSPHPCENLPDVGARLEKLEVRHPAAETLLASFPVLRTLDLVEINKADEMGLTAHLSTSDGPRRFAQTDV